MMPLKLEDLIASWEKDSPIDDTDPAKELLRVPNLHAKYSQQLVLHNFALKAKTANFYRMRKLKTDYYAGRLTGEELKKLGWEQFQFVLKEDRQVYIDGDEDLIKIKGQMAAHEEASKLAEMIVRELNSRTYQLRAYIDWQRFIQGQ